MKKLLVLLFSILISFNSYGEWTKTYSSVIGTTFYIDKDTIKKHGGYVYWWEMADYLKPDDGYLSDRLYWQGDCGTERTKMLSLFYYKQPMGNGKVDEASMTGKWIYPSPDTIGKDMLNYICDYVK